jgi:hypothetical protein
MRLFFSGGHEMDKEQSQDKPLAEPKTSGMAIASLVLGICGFVVCGIAGIVGLILGIVGLSSIRKSAGQLKGEGLAIAGIAVSSVSIVLIPFLIALLMPALSRVRNQGKTAVAMANAHQLSLAFTMYNNENNGRLPPSDEWLELMGPYIGNNQTILNSPFDPEAGRAWAMNPHLRTAIIERAGKVVLFFECRFGSPPGGGPELLPEKPRGRRGYIFGFADYHVECVPPERLDELIWEP